MQRLQGKKALVTGSGQGLGRAIAEELLRAGCDVAVHYCKSADGAEEVKGLASGGTRAECFAADLTIPLQASTMVNDAFQFLGGLDILVNNSGDILGRRWLGDIDDDFWD